MFDEIMGVAQGLPYPPGGDRAAWEGLPAALRGEILAGAREVNGTPYPAVTATQFMAYVRDGNRGVFEVPYFGRRQHLIRTTVGECAAWSGEFLGDVVDGLWMIAEETSWVVSAHNVDNHPGSVPPAELPLPDKENPVIDLFAAQTAATVTLCCHLLGDRLDAVTPLIRRRMRREVEERVLRPFFQHDDFGWMGMIRPEVNNWTPWIVSNILTCLLYWIGDPQRRAEGVRRAMEMVRRYVDSMPEDGGCDEGAAYWNMAGASLLDCLELVRHATGGAADDYADAKLRAIGAFPLAAHIDGDYFWNFADCDAKPMISGERVWRYGMRTDNAALSRLGLALLAREGTIWPQDTPQMARLLDRLFMPAQQDEPGYAPREGVVMLPDLQVWACRRGRYYAAIKGGHNGESHNHNDVGSFLLYIDGQPAVIDAGNMVYTAKTFSDARYTLWNTRSMNHNLPLINGCEQAAGAAHRAEEVRMDEDGVSMQLRGAYPVACGVSSYVRQARMEADGLHLHDMIETGEAAPVTWVFLLRHEPRIQPGLCEAGNVVIRFPEGLAASAEPYPVEDARMARSYPGTLWRLSLTAGADTRHEAAFVLT